MTQPEFVYRLIEQEAWENAQRLEHLPYADIDDRDGFLHLSTYEQMLLTAGRYFSHLDKLLALEIAFALLASVIRFETPTSAGVSPNAPGNSEQFPHLYGALPIASISRVLLLKKTADGSFIEQGQQDNAS